MASFLAHTLLLSLLTISTVLGCGPGGPTTTSTRTFNVTGFTLPVQMVFSMAQGAAAQVPGIAPTAGAASGFVMHNVMQAVFDVLERQGRAAGLSDPIIQFILGQLTVSINYQPLECKDVEVNPSNPQQAIRIVNMMMPKCIIIGNTVTAICNVECMLNNPMTVLGIPSQHLSISGTLTTTNPIMANWSREMWQGVVNRVVRTLASGPFGSNFFSAVATVS